MDAALCGSHRREAWVFTHAIVSGTPNPIALRDGGKRNCPAVSYLLFYAAGRAS
jgi:hypothetical protein